MRRENYDRAKVILSRIEELEKMHKWLSDIRKGIFIIASNERTSEMIIVSDNMKNIMLEQCQKEITDFDKEFDSL